jgi:hypothetical protein
MRYRTYMEREKSGLDKMEGSVEGSRDYPIIPPTVIEEVVT